MHPVDFLTYNFRQMGIPIRASERVELNKKGVLLNLAMRIGDLYRAFLYRECHEAEEGGMERIRFNLPKQFPEKEKAEAFGNALAIELIGKLKAGRFQEIKLEVRNGVPIGVLGEVCQKVGLVGRGIPFPLNCAFVITRTGFREHVLAWECSHKQRGL